MTMLVASLLPGVRNARRQDRTLTMSGTNAAGKKYTSTAVNDKP
jgi:hypothetical protein